MAQSALGPVGWAGLGFAHRVSFVGQVSCIADYRHSRHMGRGVLKFGRRRRDERSRGHEFLAMVALGNEV